MKYCRKTKYRLLLHTDLADLFDLTAAHIVRLVRLDPQEIFELLDSLLYQLFKKLG
jgi:hypothetical protein